MGQYANYLKPGQNHCKYCGYKHKIIAAAYACCLFAPEEKTGWCAWCGDSVDNGLTFCNKSCADEYNFEMLSYYKQKRS